MIVVEFVEVYRPGRPGYLSLALTGGGVRVPVADVEISPLDVQRLVRAGQQHAEAVRTRKGQQDGR